MTFHCEILSTSKTSADVPPNKAIHTERKWRSDFSLKLQITRAISARRSQPLDAGKDERNSTMANPLAVAGPNSKYQQPGAAPDGFLAGLWHGLILPITFLVSLFNSDVRISEKNNSGRW